MQWARLIFYSLLFSALTRPLAAESELPIGRFGVAIGVRNNLQEVADAYALGWFFGLNAGFHPQSLPVGVTWSITKATVYRNDPSLVNESISILDMSLGLEGRLRVAEVERYLFASIGSSIVRAGEPLPPANKQSFIGPYLGMGYQELFGELYVLNFETRYGLVGGLPSLIFSVGINVGSH